MLKRRIMSLKQKELAPIFVWETRLKRAKLVEVKQRRKGKAGEQYE
jgi:hypothetical protein